FWVVITPAPRSKPLTKKYSRLLVFLSLSNCRPRIPATRQPSQKKVDGTSGRNSSVLSRKISVLTSIAVPTKATNRWRHKLPSHAVKAMIPARNIHIVTRPNKKRLIAPAKDFSGSKKGTTRANERWSSGRWCSQKSQYGRRPLEMHHAS